jgi:hypothetical protein
VGDLTIDLMVTEIALTDGWPDLAEDWSGQWAIADMRKLHDPDPDPDAGRRPACTICARRTGRAAA